jgi:hypothetical protein
MTISRALTMPPLKRINSLSTDFRLSKFVYQNFKIWKIMTIEGLPQTERTYILFCNAHYVSMNIIFVMLNAH